MPVLYYDKDKDEKKDASGQPQNTNQQVLGATSQQKLGGEAQTDLGAGSGGQEPQGTRSGSFTNLQSYLKAAEGQNLGQDVAGKVRSSLGEASAAREPVGTQYRKDIADKRVNYDEDFTKGILDKPTAISNEDRAKWDKQYNAAWEAPTLQDSDVIAKQKRAQDLAGMATDQSQRQALLKEFYGKPSYQSGQQKLDQLLLSAQPEAFAGIGDQASQEAAALQSWRDTLAGEAGAAKTATERARQQTRAALGVDANGNIIKDDPTTPEIEGGALGQTEFNLEEAARLAREGYQPEYNALKQAIDTRTIGGLTPEQQAVLGLTEGQRMWGLTGDQLAKIGQFSAIDPSRFKKETMTSEDDYNRLQALYGLGNQEIGWTRAEDPGLTDPYSFNKDAVQAELAARERGYGTSMEGARQDWQAADPGMSMLGSYYQLTPDEVLAKTDAILKAGVTGASNRPLSIRDKQSYYRCSETSITTAISITKRCWVVRLFTVN